MGASDDSDFFSEGDDDDDMKSKKKKKKAKAAVRGSKNASSSSGKRCRKDLTVVLWQDRLTSHEKDPPIAWEQISVGPSLYPPRQYCSVCGFFSNIRCHQCGTRTCGLRCTQIHKDTKCSRS
eukprot:GHVL01033925.1.p1 GENE.GHVL01033925.1~~GHVL01033925.1.p1  ORF type:complete len:122 (-),score=27.48 GHVL01033925.1:715-1080(-)